MTDAQQSRVFDRKLADDPKLIECAFAPYRGDPFECIWKILL